MWNRLLLFGFFASVCSQARETRLVNIAQGPVRGYKDKNFDIFAYYDIPYATAPNGSDKFKAPLDPPKWDVPYEAESERIIICPQVVYGEPPPYKIQEDCLVTSIYTPSTQIKKLPVVVYVHGGGFQRGYGHLNVPKNIVATQTIIAVTFNYRLGAHGFLCLGTQDVPGNAGMKDQVALLRWVKANIASFGGDPDDVTISGCSAGGVSVDLLMISEMAKGLFKRVNSGSGVSISTFGVQVDPIKNAQVYAKLIGFNYDNVKNIYELEDFYKSVPIELLNSGDVWDRPDMSFVMIPCVERETGEEIFLDKSPLSILKSGSYQKYPSLYGFSNMEGLFRISLFDSWKNEMNANFSNFLPCDLKFESDRIREEVAEKVKTFYFGDGPITKEKVLAYIDYFSDALFIYSILRSVKLQVDANNTHLYLYEYSFVDNNTDSIPYTNTKGANHCAQSSAVFDSNIAVPTDEFLNVVDYMRKVWLNFKKTGDPAPEQFNLPKWPPVGAARSPHMALDTTMHLEGSLNYEKAVFWDEIYDKYYNEPQPPPAPQVELRTTSSGRRLTIVAMYMCLSSVVFFV